MSALFTPPPFQSGLGYYTPGGEQTLAMRGTPDVAMLGDPSTGIAVVVNGDPTLGGLSHATDIIGGTSVAAPEMAAMWALVLQACAQSSACVAKGSGAHPYRLGDPDPLFYGIYGGGTGVRYPATFVNVTYGDNAQLCVQPTAGASPEPAPTCATSAPSLLTGFSAGPGYNLTTGIGVPFGRALIKAVVGV